MKTFTIEGRKVGEGHPPYMIAEIGINHNGDMQIAKRLIDAAFATNWDCVKFQKRFPEECVPEDQKNVEKQTPWGTMTYLDYRKRVEFEKEEYDYISSYCKEKPISWAASIWDVRSLEFISDYDVPFIKIPSAKLNDVECLTEVSRQSKPIVLSTGMSTIEELDSAVNILEKNASGNYLLMHTNSAYPAPHKDLNLKMIATLRERYSCVVGYSGHEYDLEPTLVAVTLGASIIERHITLSHDMWGSDQFASLEVHGMDLLLKRIKNINVFMGDGEKRISSGERKARQKLRGN